MHDAKPLWVRLRTQLDLRSQSLRASLPGRLAAWRTQLATLRTAKGWQELWRMAWPLLAYAASWVIALYVASALAFALSPKVEGPVPLYLTGPVTVSALLLAPRRHWWRYLVLTFPLIGIAFWLLRLPLSAAVVWTAVFVYVIIFCVSVVSVTLLLHVVEVPPRFATVREVGWFVACVAAGALPAILIASTARTVVFSWDFWLSWQMGYLGYVLGIVVFTPAIVLWLTDGPRGLGLTTQRRQVELLLLCLATLLVSGLIFGTRLTDVTIAHTLIYVLVPLLIWAAIRFGPQGLASALTLTAALAITGAVNNLGPFVGASATANTLALQLFLLFVAVPLYFLAALVQERERANAALHLSEARYHATFDSAAIGVAVTDLDGRPLEVNGYASQMLGYVPDELRTLALRDFTHPDDVADNEALLRRALEGDIGSYQLEKRYLHKDGHSVWGRLSASLVRGQDDQPAYFVVHLEDITPRKQLEHQRDEQASQLAALQAVSDTALTHLGLDDVLQAVLDRIHGVLGLEHAAIRLLEADGQTLGSPTTSGYDWLLAAPFPLELGQGFAGRIAASREPLMVDDMTGFPVVDPAQGVHLRSAVGVPLLLEGRLLGVLYSGSTTPRHFTDHEVHLLQVLADRVAVAVDRARLFEAERTARADSEQRREELDRIFEQSAEGLAVYDAMGRLVRTNAAQRRLLGLEVTPPEYAAEDLTERAATFQARDLDGHPLPPERAPVPRALKGEVISGTQAVDMQLRTWDGRDLVIRTSAAPLRDREGRIIGAVSVVSNRTERQQLRREREEARVQAERRAEELDRVFEAMADGVAVYDLDGREVRTNTALQRLLRMDLAPPDYASLSLHERMALFAARDEQGRPLAADEGPLPHALRGEIATGSATMDLRSRTFEGRELELSVSAAPLRDGAGHVTGAVALFRDQTERNQLLRDRAEQAEQLDRIVEQMTEPLVVQDAAGRIVRVNAAMRRLVVPDALPSGYEEAPLPERVALYTMRDAQGNPLVPEDTPNMRALRGEVLSGERAMDVRMRTPDGREAELRISAAPLRNHEGHIVGTVGVGVDLTERNQLAREREEALARAQSRSAELEAVLGAMTDGVVVYDVTARITYTNAAFRTLFAVETRPDYARLSLAERNALIRARTLEGHDLPEDQLPQARVLRGEVLTSGVDGAASDLLGDTLDGRTLILQLAGGPLRDAGGTVTGAVLVFRDVTERRRLQREWGEARANELALREVNERLDTFVVMAAHDLRSPVSVSRMVVERAQQLLVQAAAEVDVRAAQGKPAQGKSQGKPAQALIRAAQAVDTTAHNLDRLLRLVQQLLDVSRVRQGTLVLQRQPVDMAEVVRTCVDEQRLLNPSRVITVDLPELATGGPGDTTGAVPAVVDADVDRLSQVLTNYLTNAVRYSPDDQPIEVELQIVPPSPPDVGGPPSGPPSGPPVARVTVRDHGTGIPLEEQATIWERFQRARTMREASGGLGLGLYIARMIVDLHGGSVGVESTVGHGSTFWFTLPLASAPT